MNRNRNARTRVPVNDLQAEFARALRAVGFAVVRADAEAWVRPWPARRSGKRQAPAANRSGRYGVRSSTRTPVAISVAAQAPSSGASVAPECVNAR